ncbi:RNA processing protein [Perkinsus olseni]|uniref:RNA processing protein n=2 Tax=Perkinsus olseni TaxID=32597 RepID=A0A7J6LZV0_PEROL|nr:RNA processing protein [Perkinsus olseni]
MVLPMSLLKTAQGQPIMVELKNGEAYSGVLANCDSWMNLHIRDAVLTSKDGDRFWKLAEAYIRGNHVKYLRIPDGVVDMVQEDAIRLQRMKAEKMTTGKGKGKGKGKGAGMPAGKGRGEAAGPRMRRNKVDHRGGGRGARSGKKYVEEEDFDAIARRNRDVEQIKRRQQQQAKEEESSSDDEPAAAAAAAAAAPAQSKRAPEVKPAAGSDSDDDIAPIGADQKRQPTRREREAAAKEAAHKAYLEKQAKGETAEFKAQARRLAEVRARREAAAKKREAEEAAMAEGGITGSTEGPTLGVQAGREPPNRPTSALAEAMGATTMTAGPRRRGGGKKKGKH